MNYSRPKRLSETDHRTANAMSHNRTSNLLNLSALSAALKAMISIADVAVDPGRIVDQPQILSGVVPEAALSIICGQMQRIANQLTINPSIETVIGLAIRACVD